MDTSLLFELHLWTGVGVRVREGEGGRRETERQIAWGVRGREKKRRGVGGERGGREVGGERGGERGIG